MEISAQNSTADGLTDLILTMFRTNNLTLTWGDRLVSPLGLTSARWQILEAIVRAERSQPVAWLARDLGANRQNVQRIANDLMSEGLISLEPNPHHKRARLIVLTPKGQQTYEAALGLYYPLVGAMAEGLSAQDVAAAQRVMSALRAKLEKFADEDEPQG
jgi:DNA-binding MarR family transcriptional regulator